MPPGNFNNIGNRIIRLKSVRSTNDYAYQLAARGMPEGCIVVAEEQTAGKGRLGRQWNSPRQQGLWFSVILRPLIPSRLVTLFPFLASVAVAQSIQTCFQITPHLKWPNDLLINHKKIGGILTEAATESNVIKFIILGIGINVYQQPEDFPPALRAKAGSISLFTTREIDLNQFFRQIQQDFNSDYSLAQKHGFTPILKRWKSLCKELHQPITLHHNNQILSGIFYDLAVDGGLLLQQPNRLIKIVAGEIQFEKENSNAVSD